MHRTFWAFNIKSILKCQIESPDVLGFFKLKSKTAWPNDLKFFTCLFETIGNQYVVKYLNIAMQFVYYNAKTCEIET